MKQIIRFENACETSCKNKKKRRKEIISDTKPKKKREGFRFYGWTGSIKKNGRLDNREGTFSRNNCHWEWIRFKEYLTHCDYFSLFYPYAFFFFSVLYFLFLILSSYLTFCILFFYTSKSKSSLNLDLIFFLSNNVWVSISWVFIESFSFLFFAIRLFFKNISN